MSRTTIHDIAQLAGVGKATVSRVLNRTGYVSEETRRKVEKVIREHTYTPSAMARNLSRRASDTIGVIIPEADNPFFAEILKGISGVVDDHNLTLIFCNTDNTMEKDLRSLHTVYKQQVRGLIYTPAIDYAAAGKREAVRQILDKLRVPVVVLDRPLDGLDLDGVFSDNNAGAYAATQALIRAGHRRIGIVAGDLELSIGRERLKGFERALSDHGLAVERRHVVKGRFDASTSYRLTQQLLAGKNIPTAFFAANNLSAYGFLKAVFEKGFKIPDDMGFISFDRLGNLNDLGFRLSYTDRDVIGMGVEAMRLLLAKIENPGKRTETIVCPSKLSLLGSERAYPAKQAVSA
ncbi:MAG: LacI family transcriptional regulator [Planctomycetota bacterium]|nr:LacI family transcriptional regulator [Planctomycetota bacterium]